MSCEKEYIEREAAIANSREYDLGGSYDNTERAVPVDVINSIPAADVRPVVRGKWIKINGLIACSVCKEHPPLIYHNFCPNCGADMRIVNTHKQTSGEPTLDDLLEFEAEALGYRKFGKAEEEECL